MTFFLEYSCTLQGSMNANVSATRKPYAFSSLIQISEQEKYSLAFFMKIYS